MPEQQTGDLVLTPGEQAFVLDNTKGIVSVYVGPHKVSLSQTDSPMVWDHERRRFKKSDLSSAIQAVPNAPEGYYIVLENPAESERDEHPREGTANPMSKLRYGMRVNIPGPANFPLWPSQHAKVIPGHHLRSNQFLLVRVYNEQEAMENWARAVVRPQAPSGETTEGAAPAASAESTIQRPERLTMGQLLTIRGTDVSFYIPPTGVEVLPEDGERYVREAVTLEQLEYCILTGEDGNKRYVRGPDVVFPEPTEQFVTRDSKRKFRAIELNEISGIHVKVIAPYEEGGRQYAAGQELFITGREQAIYYPRDEHVIITYGDQQPVHFAIAIPAGEGRYVLNRLSGEVTLVRGPRMFLPNPINEVIVRRVLDEKTVKLWYPGNEKAVQVNRDLMELSRTTAPGEPLTHHHVERLAATLRAPGREEPGDRLVAEEFRRKQTFTQPRTITLDTKYEGAVMVEVWTGYAVLITSRRGERRVVVGPETILLDYDETLMPMELSTGTPKTEDRTLATVYLRVAHNRVSDIVAVETKDLCEMQLTVSYRVNFEDDPNRWFAVENYVKFLTDHLRSMLRNAAKQYGVEEFYEKAISIIRDAILGTAQEGSQRRGRPFNENGMRVYDVEVLDVKIADAAIAQLLVKNQHDVVRSTLEVEAQERKLELTKRAEVAKRGIAEEEAETRQKGVELEEKNVASNLKLAVRKILAEAKQQTEKLTREQGRQKVMDAIAKAENIRTVDKAKAAAEATKQEAMAALDQMRQETEELVKRAGAVNPDLVAALQAFQDIENVERLAKAVAPLAILGGDSVVDVITRLFKGTPLEALTRRLSGDSASRREPALRS